ncbi:MAG: DUF4388 domain-containing protein [Anaerolineae bacterium]|nr:DUF4388 domain-containing protein [Anaerolineae bacterium]MDW8171170.1 DUF4388 domain-containing protein [Anaerolineae bacterium]
MPLQGNIRDFSTTQLLNLVNLSRRTGMLTIYEGLPTGEKDAMKNDKMAPGKERARVAFNKGKLTYAAMLERDNSLVTVLNKAGKLTDEQARVLRERASNITDKALAMRLIGAKYVTQQDILDVMRRHTEDIIYELMTWTEGPFRFDDNEQPSSDVIPVLIELENVIIEGGRRITEQRELDKFIDDLDASLEFADNPKERFKGIHLSVNEWKVVSYVNPKNTIRQIMKVLNMSEVEIKRILYSLNQAGLVEIVKPQAVRPGVKAPTPAASVAQRKPQARPQKPPEKKVVLSLIEKLKSM